MRDFLDVLTLHKRMGFPCSEYPSLPPKHVFRFRHQFLVEELEEYHTSYHASNLVGVVDALLDFAYVACGSALFIGAPRSGPQANWPSFRTACGMLQANGIIDEGHQSPHLLRSELHIYTLDAMRARVAAFLNAYLAAIDEKAESSYYLMLLTLKQCCDEAYKSAALMAIPWEKCWIHVAESNMKKKPGIVEKRNAEYDLVKPHGWLAPEARIAYELVADGWHIPPEMEVDSSTGKVRMITGRTQ